ncbi:cholesterol 7-desaturase nvd isoform X1 [Schistocerca gregaria]|uniref:cholesterol 7-desaturase nvd isoform X1 n=2 Tax=Schistocerca gregaria TaxID=7010 RepID=UPI00211ED5CA|nr:cholesterol 7-desaturase nvd isoform X1 [Schistocerca gregaria]
MAQPYLMPLSEALLAASGKMRVDMGVSSALEAARLVACACAEAAPLVLACVKPLCALVGLWFFVRYLVLNIDWTKDLCDVGYQYACEGARGRRRGRRDAVREVRRQRKLGRLPPVYPNGWFAVLEADRLRPGQVQHVSALGENLAVFRAADAGGRVHVLDAYCPHLGANMAVGGAVRGGCLECPFHGWRFRGADGRCTSVPYADKVPEIAKVRRWESCEVNGLVFVWYHAEGEPPSWRPEQLPQLADGSWRYRGRSEFLINAHIEEIPENGGDIAHLNAIHGPSLLAGSDLRTCERLWLSFARHVWAADWAPSTQPGRTHTATMNVRHELRLFGKVPVVSMKVQANQIGPGYVVMHMETSLGSMVILQCVTPLEPLLQKVIHRIFCPPHMFLYANIALIGEAIMFERDIMVWNHKKYEDKPLLVKEDRAISKHRRWYSQFYSENSPQFSFVRENMEW